MHNCEEFRERLTEHIIDREDVRSDPEFQNELLLCSSCSEFYAESREMMEALSEVDLTVSEIQWKGIQQRLQARIRNLPQPPATVERLQPKTGGLPARPRITIPVWATSAALLVLTLGLSRLTVPIAEVERPRQSEPAVYLEHSVPLDPVTVDFLQESELLLRNVMKMEPNDVDDLADARKVASEQLAELPQRMQAAAEVPPVVGVMETYETVLRDLRNVDERYADEDISDLQKRIRQNGLIANMKAFQPRVTEVSFGLK